MPQVAAYHRPNDLAEAVNLLAGPNRVALAGGTIVNADREPPAVEVVDLQALGIDGIEPDGARVRLGAMVTLDRMAVDPAVPGWLRDLARAELPSTLRTLATIGGTVAAGEADSVLLAGLLAAGARVELAGVGPDTGPSDLAELLAGGRPPGALITAVTVDPTGTAATATTGRTPADVPIVAAVAHRAEAGDTRLALTGVAATPVLVDPDDPIVGLDPSGDFRGSVDYRRHLAGVLAVRAIEEVSR